MVELHMPLSAGKPIAVVDVMPSSASVAIIMLPYHGAARIVAEAHTLIPHDEVGGRQAGSAISMMLEDVCERALRAASSSTTHVDTVHVVVHSPWVKSRSVRTAHRFPEEELVTEEMVRGVAHEALVSTEQADVVRIFEATATRIWLNGYPVRDTTGKHANTVSVASLISTCTSSVRQSIVGVMEKAFPSALVVPHSALSSALTVYDRIQAKDDPYVFIGIGIDATQTIVVHDGVVTKECSIKEGTRTILARVAKERPAEETLGFIRMLERDACADAACDAIKSAMAAAEPEMARVFGECIARIASEQRLPNRLVLLAHGDLLDWLSRFFSRIDFSQFTVTTLPFEVIPLNGKLFSPWIANTGDLPPSTALSTAAAIVQERE